MELFLSEFTARCRGAILGTAFGDALGLPVEGLSASRIEQLYGVIENYLPGPGGVGRTSDDTQLTLATGLSLVRQAGVDGADCARSCAELFEPDRGYGRSASQVLTALRRGHDYRQTGRLLFPEGSYGNGAAMRIAPIGLMCGTLPVEALRLQVFEAVRSTHVHAEAIDAALVIALVVGRFSRLSEQVSVDSRTLLNELGSVCQDPTMRAKLDQAEALLTAGAQDRVAVEQIGCGVRGGESVVLALFLACRYLDDAEAALVNAVRCGGDTDTIAALVGAVVGARHGDQAFPARWHAGLERGDSGYEALVHVAEELAATTLKRLLD